MQVTGTVRGTGQGYSGGVNWRSSGRTRRRGLRCESPDFLGAWVWTGRSPLSEAIGSGGNSDPPEARGCPVATGVLRVEQGRFKLMSARNS